jgi:hypothetical protein
LPLTAMVDDNEEQHSKLSRHPPPHNTHVVPGNGHDIRLHHYCILGYNGLVRTFRTHAQSA